MSQTVLAPASRAPPNVIRVYDRRGSHELCASRASEHHLEGSPRRAPVRGGLRVHVDMVPEGRRTVSLEAFPDEQKLPAAGGSEQRHSPPSVVARVRRRPLVLLNRSGGP